jgi:2-C-methyl-D-erythritol 4-phosphate cytidylyltransferase/2-C-methyl-D-erythritol 2,4-cyclodiphosphate synthase
MSVGVIIVAGGRGARMGGDVPKQLIEIGGRSILRRSIDTFDGHPRVDCLVVVLPAEVVTHGASGVVGATSKPCHVTAGGETRQASVRNGLEAMPAAHDVILVHDAARPFASAELVDRVISAAEDAGAAVPALQATETIKRVGAGHAAEPLVRETIPRDEIWLAQTPQGFQRRVLAEAMQRAVDARQVATDDAMLVEQAGHPVRVVMGDAMNRKITTPEDLAAARAYVAGPPRVGIGYDLHRLAEGRPLVLAGIDVPFGRGPVAHSDGDVVCHAIVDAILGAAGSGDIGRHFPDTDPRWKNAAGLELLARTVAIVGGEGWTVSSVDATVVLERPKIGPHMAAIVSALAGTLGMARERVGLKAKTNEGVDAVGRGEAIAAHAVAVLVRRELA